MDKSPRPDDPVMIDKVIGYIQDTLIARLSWLNFAFGRSQRMTKSVNGVDMSYPGFYLNSGEYKNMLPTSDYGNYCFFTTDDPQTVEWSKLQKNTFKVPFSLIFWYDITKVYPERERNTERVKADILKALKSVLIKESGNSFEIEKIYEKAENIFKGFNYKESKTQYLMHPYSGLRIEGEINFKESCND